ncbi:hypothetical protein [Burkholderia sp. Ac-20344]|uniref:hypothetical protein n=1 Tax=Burkholderia sp. Ac-20344 TaxID=2703890 RepID=UPI00197C41D7|nr:hypothetical protein [Burkholderia sp. Ac-20344]MBN3835442.1 hypothetical protein [Burkholderia sp. Ac-20344]
MPDRLINIGLYCRIYDVEFELIRAVNWLVMCRERGVLNVRWMRSIVIGLINFFAIIGSK